MDLSLVLVLAVPFAVLLWLPLLGRLWSSIVSYLVFGPLFVLGVFGYFANRDAGGSGPSFAIAYLWVGVFAFVMLTLASVTFLRRKKKLQVQS